MLVLIFKKLMDGLHFAQICTKHDNIANIHAETGSILLTVYLFHVTVINHSKYNQKNVRIKLIVANS